MLLLGIAFEFAFEFAIGSKMFEIIGFLSLILLPKNSSFGLGLFCLAVPLQATKASGNVVGVVLIKRCFAVLTAASACPFDCRL